jgi:CDP-paratose 2-epimerase
VLAGAGQFGKPDQGIFSYWIHSFKEKRPLKYIGFNGSGHQVRDVMHPKDLSPLLASQMIKSNSGMPEIINLGGGIQNSLSLKQVTNWCFERFGQKEIISSQDVRPMDAPWIVMDSSTAKNAWDWKPNKGIDQILEEIADFADNNPNWLSLT